MAFRGRGGGGGGFGRGRGGGGGGGFGRGGGGGRGGFRGGRGGFGGGFRRDDQPQGPPEEVLELGSFSHVAEDEIILKASMEKVPYFNAPIFLQNKAQIGKVDEIFGPIRDYYVSVKLSEGVKASGYKQGDKFFCDPAKLLPLARFLPQPKGARGARGGGRGRGGRGGGPPRGGRGGGFRGGSFRGSPRGGGSFRGGPPAKRGRF